MISPHLAGSVAVLSLVTLLGSGCAAPAAPPPPDVALSAPSRAAGPAAEPVKDTPLTPGTRYRFADVLPGLLDVEVTAPDPQLFTTFDPTRALLTPDTAHATDGLAFMAAFAMRVQRDPYDCTQPCRVVAKPSRCSAKYCTMSLRSGSPWTSTSSPSRSCRRMTRSISARTRSS